MKRWITGLLLAGCACAQQVDYNSQVQNAPGFLSDQQRTPFATVYVAGAAAVASSKVLALTKVWMVTTSGTIPGQIAFNGGVIQPAAGQTVTFTVQSAPLATICDISLGGGCIIYGPNSVIFPAWWGAKGDATGYTGGTDDTVALQATFNGAPNGPIGGGAPNIATTISFSYGRYKISNHIVIPAAKNITVIGAGVPNGNSAEAYIWQTNANANTFDACTTPPAGFSVQNMGFDGPAVSFTAGTGSAICLGASTGPAVFDSTITHNYFRNTPNAAIFATSEEGYDIGDNVSTLGNYFFLCAQGATQCDNNRIHDNWIYSQRKAGIYIAKGIDNAIRDNQFYLNGDATNSFGAIVLNSTPSSGSDTSIRNTAITTNSFHANNYDIVLRGTASVSGNTGIIGALISDNTSDLENYSGIYVNTADQVKIISNRISSSSQATLNTYPAIDLEGATDQVTVESNMVTLSSAGTGANYALFTGSSTTNTVLGINQFVGQTGRVNLNGSQVAAVIDGNLTCANCGGGGGGGGSYGSLTNTPSITTSSFTGSIPAAITSLGAGGGTIIVNQNTSAAVTTTIPSNITLSCNPNVTITNSTSTTDVLSFASAATNVSIIGCNIAGGNNGISGNNISFITIKNNTITGYHTSGIITGTPAVNMTISGNTIKSCATGCSDAIFIQDPISLTTITNNLIDTTGSVNSGTGGAHGIAVHTFSGGGAADRLTIAGNFINHFGSNFMIEVTQNSSGGTINGCTIGSNHLLAGAVDNGAISVGGGVNCDISDNDINMNAKLPNIASVEVVNSSFSTLNSNSVYNVAANGTALSIDSSNHTIASGNQWGGFVLLVDSGTFSGVVNLSDNQILNSSITIPTSSTVTTAGAVHLQCNVTSCSALRNSFNGLRIAGVSASGSVGINLELDTGTVDSTQILNTTLVGFTTGITQSAGITNTTTAGTQAPAPQKFFGTSAPGSIVGNLPGDTFFDTTGHVSYFCNAVPTTQAPACTSVASGQWTLSSGATTPGGTNGQIQVNNSGALGGLNSTGTGNVVRAATPTISNLTVTGTCTGCASGSPYSSIINAGSTIACDGTTNDTTAWNVLLAVSGGTIIMPKNCISIVGGTGGGNPLLPSGANITLDCEGSTLKLVTGGVNQLILLNGVAGFTMHNCTLDGNSENGVTSLFEADSSTELRIYQNVFQNVGTPGILNLSIGVNFSISGGIFQGNHVTNIAGSCVMVSGSNAGWEGLGNHLDHCYKEGMDFFQSTTYTFVGNTVDHVYDYGGGGTGQYGNGVYVAQAINTGTITGNTIKQTEYSGIRIADSVAAAITGNHFIETGDWCILGSEFTGGENNISGNTCKDGLGGGIFAGNAADDLNYGINITGNSLYNMAGCCSIKTGLVTPVFGMGVLADGMTSVMSNLVDGAYYGVVCANGGGVAFTDFGCIMQNNNIMDTRPITIAVSSTTGSVVGMQNGVGTDLIYTGTSLSAAKKVAAVVSCAPINTGVTCTAPTTLTVRMLKGLFVATDAIVDSGPTGNLTATAGTVVGPYLDYVTLASTTNFNLFDAVTIGSGATLAKGRIVCSTSVTTNSKCPLANHIVVQLQANASNILVPIPATGTLTDSTTSATSAISASALTPNHEQVGVMMSAADIATTCSLASLTNNIAGYAVQPIGGLKMSSGFPDGAIYALGTGSCVTRSPMMGGAPIIASGFGTSPAFVGTPTDTAFTINIGTGGSASSGVITFAVPYTNQTPSCVASEQGSILAVKVVPTITNLTLSVSGAFGVSDLISVQCSGGN